MAKGSQLPRSGKIVWQLGKFIDISQNSLGPGLGKG